MFKSGKKVLSLTLCLFLLFQLIPFAVFAGGTEGDQSSSLPEKVYVNSYAGEGRSHNFDKNWRFNLGEVNNAQETAYNDFSWRDVSLPHDYSIEQDYTAMGEAESGYLPGGIGWYRKNFSVSSEWKNRQVRIDFGGVYMNSSIWLNGHKLGTHPYGYTPFSFDLTPYLNFDGENVLAVRVENTLPTSRWYSGSGIYRSVNLVVTDPVHVGLYGTTVTTPNIASEYENGDVTVNIKTRLENSSANDAKVILKHTLYAKGSDTPFAESVATEVDTVLAGSEFEVEKTFPVTNPDLWSVDTPNLYTVKTEVLNEASEVLDTHETEFGFRWFDFGNNSGFSLNGDSMKLQGVCMHHDQGSLGSAAYRRAIERQVEILKEMGCNSIRVTHNPAADELIEVCNEKGMLLIEEAFDTWVRPKNGNNNDYSVWFDKKIEDGNAILNGVPGETTWAEFDLGAMIKRGINSPAIISWSIGNEVMEGINTSGLNPLYLDTAQKLIDWTVALDPTRPVTTGENKLKANWGEAVTIGNKLTEAGGIVGFNYTGSGQYNSFHNSYPDWKIYGAETASAISSRDIYKNKGQGSPSSQLLSSYDKQAVGWGHVASSAWYDIIINDFNAGEYVWTGFDYLGEPTPWNGTGSGAVGAWPSPKSSYFGIVDTAGLPKDTYYFYQSQWNNDLNTLHILPAWNEDAVQIDGNGNVEVVVYSDAAKVELFFTPEGSTDVKSLGSKDFTEKTTSAGHTYQIYEGADKSATAHQNLYLTWQVPYADGTISAVAYDKDGNIIEDTDGRSTVITTDKAEKIDLEADRVEINADGQDLSYISVDITDKDGNIVPTADNLVNFEVVGDGELIALDNGSQKDHTSYQDSGRKAHSGRLVAIVRSTKDTGSFTLRAKAEGLADNSVTVNTKAVSEPSGEKTIESYTISKNYYVKKGTPPILPLEIELKFSDNTSEQRNVTWEDGYLTDGSLDKVGTFAVSGKIEGTDLTATVNVIVLDEVAALLNYSTYTTVGAKPVLPDTRPAVLADGTILDAEFPVIWDKLNDSDFGTEGTVKISGTAKVLGENIPVVAFVRVAKEDISIGANVAANFLTLTQNIPEDLQSDTLTAIADGSTTLDPNTGGGANPSAWTDYDYAQAGFDNPEVIFTFATAQRLGQVRLHMFEDSYASRHPEKVELFYSLGGTAEEDWIPIEATEEKEVTKDNVTPFTYTFTPADAVGFKIRFTDKAGKNPNNNASYCTGMTEAELFVATGSIKTYSSDELTTLKVNGKEDIYGLKNRIINTPALFAEIEAESGYNAAVTILPVNEDIIRILTESEDHKTRGVYTVNLNSDPIVDPADASRDYLYTKTTATAGSAQAVSGNEGPVSFVVDNNRNTFWHTMWSENLATTPEKRWVQIELEEETLIDGYRYQPRPSVANGIVTEYRIEISLDGESWTSVATGTWAHDTSWKNASFTPAKAKFVRLYGVQTRGGNNDTPNRYMSASEIRIQVSGGELTDISTAAVTFDKESYSFTGEEIRPLPVVKLDGNTLRYGIDYILEYQNNIDPGTATAKIKGIIDFAGITTGEFIIDDINRVAISYTEDTVITSRGVKPELSSIVMAQMDIGADQEFNVIWDEIDAKEYADFGEFTVEGTVQNQTLRPTVKVIVREPIVAETVSTATLYGKAPVLPEKVKVWFSDENTRTLDVAWEMPEDVAFELEAESIVKVKGIVNVDKQTIEVVANVRVTDRKDKGNLALAKEGFELPMGVSSICPDSDSPNYIIDGLKNFSTIVDKKVWSDWERGVYHKAPWAGVILGNTEEIVGKISVGFIDEHASSDPNVSAGNKVRLPESFEIQYYTGPEFTLGTDNGNVGKWTNNPLNDDANWKTVEYINKADIPKSEDYAQMLDVVFHPVSTRLIRVLCTPMDKQWVGINELEVYTGATLNRDFDVAEIKIGNDNVTDLFDENNELTYEYEADAFARALPNYPEISVTATDNAAVTVVPPVGDKNVTTIKIVPEDGSETNSLTYKITFIEKETPDPDPETDLDISFLKFIIEYAEERKESGALDGTLPIIVEKFEKALKDAKDVLAKVSSDPDNVTQAEIDKASVDLLDAITLIDIKADKSKLERLVSMAEAFVKDKEQYSPSTFVPFEKALKEAKDIMADEISFQEEIDAAWFALANGVANLRKIPNKDALKGLLDKAKSIDSSQYTVASFARLADATDNANIVYNDKNATEKAVVSSEKAMKTALSGLVPLVITTEPSGDETVKTPDETTNTEKAEASDVRNEVSKVKQVSPKTGETKTITFALILIFTSSLLSVIIRKRKHSK